MFLRTKAPRSGEFLRSLECTGLETNPEPGLFVRLPSVCHVTLRAVFTRTNNNASSCKPGANTAERNGEARVCVSCCVFAAPRGADTHAVAMRARLSRSPRARLRHLVAGLNHVPRLVYAWKVAPISPLTEIIVRCGGTILHSSTQEMLKCNCAALSHGITDDGGAEHGNYSRHDVTGVLDVRPLLSPATRSCSFAISLCVLRVSLYVCM